MWPFLSLEEKIGRLDDEIAGLRVKANILDSAVWKDNLRPWHVREEVADLRSRAAFLESKRARLNRKLKPWEYDAYSVAEPVVLKQEAKP